MSKSIFLQDIVENIQFSNLPETWTNSDINNFSRNLRLYDYQQKALINAIKGLWLYYEKDFDWSPNESKEINNKRKEILYKSYIDFGLKKENFIITDKNGNFPILEKSFYETNKTIEYSNFINRMSFWMATGSGKTLVIVKMIEIINDLIKNKEIPSNDILILIPRDDLINQLKFELNEYNQNNYGRKINLVSLKNYSQEKYSNKFNFENEVTVFYYRSDNLSDIQKDVQIDYKNYDNNGNWYVFLDEAHKGSNDDSKIQAYCSILSREGFLFNFSATLIDKEDLATTVYNYNLKEYITNGYGKHILISDYEFNNFEGIDYRENEKKEIVVRSLLTLSFIKATAKKVRNKEIQYHEPMMVTLVNSVSKKDSDLYIFFKTLSDIAGSNDASLLEIFNSQKNKLKEEIQNKKYLFEDEKIKIDFKILDSINIEDMREYCFGSRHIGSIEAIQGKKELAFKLRTADKPFALIKIGDISNWTNSILDGYEISKSLRDETFFSNLDKEDNISILMGSRAFFEGWDSLRPNVINFINIGTGKEAKRYILQSIGRGVRLSPIKNLRLRAKKLILDYPALSKITQDVDPIETLFIYATNKKSVETVLETIKEQSTNSGNELELLLDKNTIQFDLLIPIYETSIKRVDKLAKFHINEKALEALREYLMTPSSVLIAKNGATPDEISKLKIEFNNKSEFYFIDDKKDFKNIDLLFNKVLNHIRKQRKIVKDFKVLEEEIIHFKHIRTYLELNEQKELLEKIKKTSNKSKSLTEKELQELFTKNLISIHDYTEEIKKINSYSSKEVFRELSIENISEHYYIPLITSSKDKPDYIKHIICVPSEVRFINELNIFLKKNKFEYKWMFSKVDETIDNISIPYFSNETNDYKNFVPDFIFWFEKENFYEIVFVDPKGTSYSEYENKIDGYRELFENKNFNYKGKSINTRLLLYTEDINKVNGVLYKNYWMDTVGKIFNE
jgi:superfamily II DNA or RNA helicase